MYIYQTGCTWYIPCTYMCHLRIYPAYTMYIPGIYHSYSRYIQCIYLVYRYEEIPCIYSVYTRYINSYLNPGFKALVAGLSLFHTPPGQPGQGRKRQAKGSKRPPLMPLPPAFPSCRWRRRQRRRRCGKLVPSNAAVNDLNLGERWS